MGSASGRVYVEQLDYELEISKRDTRGRRPSQLSHKKGITTITTIIQEIKSE